MIRLVLPLLLLLVLVWAVRSLLGRWRARSRRLEQQHKAPAATPVAMLACRLCGTHVPEREAVHSATGVYCCEAHRAQAEH